MPAIIQESVEEHVEERMEECVYEPIHHPPIHHPIEQEPPIRQEHPIEQEEDTLQSQSADDMYDYIQDVSIKEDIVTTVMKTVDGRRLSIKSVTPGAPPPPLPPKMR
jgi:hypothetical protein